MKNSTDCTEQWSPGRVGRVRLDLAGLSRVHPGVLRCNRVHSVSRVRSALRFRFIGSFCSGSGVSAHSKNDFVQNVVNDASVHGRINEDHD